MSTSDLEFLIHRRCKLMKAHLTWSSKNETYDIMTEEMGCVYYSKSMEDIDKWVEKNEVKT